MEAEITGHDKLSTRSESSKKRADYQARWKKGQKKGRDAIKFTRYALTHAKKGYRCLDFLTDTGHEWYGIVDLVAIKRVKNKEGHWDNLEIILFQVKGGEQPISDREIERLKHAKVQVTWNISTKRDKSVKFAIPLSKCFERGAHTEFLSQAGFYERAKIIDS